MEAACYLCIELLARAENTSAILLMSSQFKEYQLLLVFLVYDTILLILQRLACNSMVESVLSMFAEVLQGLLYMYL